MCRYQGYRGQQYGNYYRNVPVNIEEKDDHFELMLFAPALEKENISVRVKDDTLTVSYQPADAEQQKDRNFTRREYPGQGFQRSFALNGKVEVENISAVYSDGILKIILFKNPDRNKPPQDIAVA